MTPRPRGQRKTQDPCEICFLHRTRCLCDSIPVLQYRTKLSLIIHAKELKRTTNTGTLAARALANSEVFVRGQKDHSLDLSASLGPEYRHVLFYPSEDAQDLTPEFVQQSSLPINLIVPDGNWRQASKVHSRHTELKNLPRVMIKARNDESYHLRAESTEEGMATLQAIAHAFGIIEGPEAKEALMTLYRLKLDRTLEGRGIKTFQSVKSSKSPSNV